eukprot:g68164.t1
MGDVAGVVTSEEHEFLVYVRAAVLYPPPDREVIHHSWGWFRAVGTLGVLSGLLGGASLGFRDIVVDGYKEDLLLSWEGWLRHDTLHDDFPAAVGTVYDRAFLSFGVHSH